MLIKSFTDLGIAEASIQAVPSNLVRRRDKSAEADGSIPVEGKMFENCLVKSAISLPFRQGSF